MIIRKIILILFVISLFGCVSNRKKPFGYNYEELSTCPEIIKTAASNLDSMGIDKEKIQAWKDKTISLKKQPCNVCQKFNEAAFVLRDDNGTYKAAMVKLIREVEKSEPNSVSPDKTEEIGNSLMDKKNMSGYTLARKYLSSLDDLQVFLVGEVRLSPNEARNLILDKYFIPLIKQDEKVNPKS